MNLNEFRLNIQEVVGRADVNILNVKYAKAMCAYKE